MAKLTEQRKEEIRQAVTNTFSWFLQDNELLDAIHDTKHLTEKEKEWARNSLDWKLIIL